MPGTKISTTIATSVTLGTAGYTGPISITKTGAIEPVQYGATALTIPAAAANATVTNHGLIGGGSGYGTGPNYKYGIAGGDGVKAGAGAKITNDGTIMGGSSTGGTYINSPPFVFNGGGTGVDIYGAGARLTNNGVIDGGADPGAAGVGVSVAAGAIITNYGIIAGGASVPTGGHAGEGVSITKGTVINDGTIAAGYAGPSYGAFGANGIELSAGLVTNNGLVIGGDGGAREPVGYGTQYGQGGAGILIDAAQSKLVNNGTIDGGAGAKGAGFGGIGVFALSAASIVNNGLITGGKGGAETSTTNHYYGLWGDGGDGVETNSGTRVINRGTIIGGAGGNGIVATGKHKVYGGAGGAGVSTYEAQNGNYILNQGKIIGGTGGKGAGSGGAGVDVAGTGSLVNEGLIKGGTGGAAGYSQVNGGVGGIGISVETTGVNFGIILGGNGGSGGATGLMGRGGEGGDFEFGRFTNDGFIQGGAGTNFGAGYGASLYNETMINNGVIAAGQSGGTDNGVMGVYIQASTLLNHGIIIAGGAGAAKAPFGEGGTGGTALVERRGYALNTGSILGGGGTDAADGAAYFAGAGGIGAAISGYGEASYNAGILKNTGLVLAGTGGSANGNNTIGGGGGVGITLSNGSFNNTGAILGGAGGASTHPGGEGGFGGSGVNIGAYGSFTNSGLIRGGAGGYGASRGGEGGTGVYISYTDSTGSFSNSGTISGGNGGLYGPTGTVAGFGGTGLSLLRASFANSGEISGGTGGGLSLPLGGGMGVYIGDLATFSNAKTGVIQGGYGLGATAGADGIYIRSDSGFTNAGLIVGGAVKYEYSPTFRYGAGGRGGSGVALEFSSTGHNSGTIIGGGAGSLGVNVKGVAGGAGLYMTTYYDSSNPNPFRETFFNSGQITGGAGGTGSEYGGAGGVGVYLNYGTLTNAGTITGGTGGYGKLGNGQNGDAVTMAGYSTLIVKNGAVFNGLVAARGGTGKGSDTLEVSGTSSAPLTGIGTEFIGFHNIDFAANAAWTIAGDTAGLASGQEIKGFTSSDAIELTDAAASQGQVSVGTAGIVTISAGGDIYKLDIKNATVGESFTFSDYTLRESVMSPAPAMTFLRPTQPATASPPLFTASGLDEFTTAPSFHASRLSGSDTAAWATQSSFTTALSMGALQDLSKPRQGDVQTLVTLHA